MPNAPTGDPKAHDVSEFSEKLVGTCLCGSVTVTINDNELFTKRRGHLCYCANCRKVAGSCVASNLLIEQEKVSIEDKDGTLNTYEDYATLSGNPVYRTFCSKDGNPIKSETQLYPGKVVLKMGIFPRIPQPEAEGFGLHKHDWQVNNDGIETYEIKWAGPDKKLMKEGADEEEPDMVSKGVQ
ncbi:hypothetical protein CERZMDRAFT_30995 [Cercospora zeae-maydis SCOH1-5]|uniref:CENP-V/GFA domain-containing protein n=1 Tax=Cercospora zeae-maydis SCOH1-5 TaxID=717836 RepID=A0A6A6FWN4_9PEZI|nr:hypothetical protein CERZMDRAFT_30995 [Cercospora zeae-maydis SCOH1-5]